MEEEYPELVLEEENEVESIKSFTKKESFVQKFPAFTENCVKLTSAQHHLLSHLTDLMEYEDNIVHFYTERKYEYIDNYKVTRNTVIRSFKALQEQGFIKQEAKKGRIASRYMINPYYFAKGHNWMIERSRERWDKL